MKKKKASKMKDMFRELNEAFEIMSKDSPDYLRNFMSFYDSTVRKGTLTEKTKELISIALAMNSHCLPCIALHVYNAIEFGATKQEILETAEVAVLMGGSPVFVYIKHVIDACDEFGIE